MEKEQRISLEFKDFMNLISKKSDYKMVGKYPKEYMLEYIETIKQKVNDNIDNIEELLKNTTDKLESACIIFTFLNNMEDSITNEVYIKYETELLEILKLNNYI